MTNAFLVVLFFLVYLILYLVIVNLALQKSSVLRELSSRFIPPFRNFIPGLNYAGFIAPLFIAFFFLILLIEDRLPTGLSFSKIISRNIPWLLAALASVGVWYLVPGFASEGHTDFPLAILTCIYVGEYLDDRVIRRSVLLSVVFGFGIGFVSDLQSQTFFTGIFGGWGFLDGDLLGTVALPLSTLTTLGISRMYTAKKDNKSKFGLIRNQILLEFSQ